MVTKTHSRPQVSNDNPYSEAQFKTMNYRPTYPDRFGSLEDARQWVRAFVQWYNHDDDGVFLLDAAYATHPERFVRRAPRVVAVPPAVWMNPPPPCERERFTDLMEYNE